MGEILFSALTIYTISCTAFCLTLLWHTGISNKVFDDKSFQTNIDTLPQATSLPTRSRTRRKQIRGKIRSLPFIKVLETDKIVQIAPINSLFDENLADYAIIGAVKIARGTVTFAEFSTQILSEFGENIQPHLEKIWSASRTHYNSVLAPQLELPILDFTNQ